MSDFSQKVKEKNLQNSRKERRIKKRTVYGKGQYTKMTSVGKWGLKKTSGCRIISSNELSKTFFFSLNIDSFDSGNI